MIDGKTVLAVVPARGGSKGIPKKNVKLIAGKPLIAWTIEAALISKYVDRVIVSTDCQEIATVSAEHGAEVPFLRPAELAQDGTPGIDVVVHAAKAVEPVDIVVLLQPTSPLRNSKDIDESIQLFARSGDAPVVSVTEAREAPQWMFAINNGRLEQAADATSALPATRQELSTYYTLNGAIYIALREKLCDNKPYLTPATVPFEMPIERSVDIDDMFDFFVAEKLLEARESTGSADLTDHSAVSRETQNPAQRIRTTK